MDFIKAAIKQHPAVMAQLQNTIEVTVKDPSKRSKVQQEIGGRIFLSFEYKGDIINPIILGALKQIYHNYKEVTSDYNPAFDKTYIYLFKK